MREDAYITPEYGYEKKLKEMEEAGKIKLLKKEKIIRYANDRANEYTVPIAYILVHQIVKHNKWWKAEGQNPVLLCYWRGGGGGAGWHPHENSLRDKYKIGTGEEVPGLIGS